MAQDDMGFPKWLVAMIVAVVIGGAGALYLLLRSPAETVAIAPPQTATAMPAAQSTLPPVPLPAVPIAVADARDAELARLKTELANERATREVPKTAVIAPVQPQVSGSAWLSRNDGSSDLLRGLEVSILPKVVRRDVVAACMEAKALEYERVAKDSSSHADYYSGQGHHGAAQVFVDRAKQYPRIAASIREQIKSLSSQVLTDMAFSLAVSAAKDSLDFDGGGAPAFSSVVSVHRISQVKTSADGKFVFPKIAPGDYFLHAKVDTKAIFVEWVIPFKAAGEVQINLDNSNASFLQNRK